MKSCPECKWDVIGGVCVRCLWPLKAKTEAQRAKLIDRLSKWDRWEKQFSSEESARKRYRLAKATGGTVGDGHG